MTAGIEAVAGGVLDGDRRSIARAITQVERGGPGATGLLKQIYHRSGRAFLVGVTGSPGVGKSTLVDRLVAALRKQRRTVGVLAVDPTSPFSGGAVLGDRVRMQEHAGDSGVFVRSMATRGQLGGLARATSDAGIVLDAGGYDWIVIETVGVGQAEIEVWQATDMTIVVTMPGSGDGVQALKAGVMEIADLFVVNKADHKGADRAVAEIETMLGLGEHGAHEWMPPILQTRAVDGHGIESVVETVEQFRAEAGEQAAHRRLRRVQARLRMAVSEGFLDYAEHKALEPGRFDQLVEEVASGDTDPYTAAERLLRLTVMSEGTVKP